MRSFLTRYRITIGLCAISGLVMVVVPDVGEQAFRITAKNSIEMLSILPPIFILIGLLDAWITRDTMLHLLGNQSGYRGMAMAFVMGSVGAGPLYAAFPIVGMMLNKGCTITNALIFMGAWTTTKFTLLVFEASTLGWRFMLLRLCLDIPTVLLIAYITARTLNTREQTAIYQQVQTQ